MGVVAGFVVIVATIGFAFGLINVVYPMRSLRVPNRRVAVGIMVVSFGLTLAAGPFLPEVPDEPSVEVSGSATTSFPGAVETTSATTTSTQQASSIPSTAATSSPDHTTPMTGVPSEPVCVKVGSTMLIDESCFDEPWPLTVDRGTLACEADAVTFVVDGVVYAVNGLAMTWDLGGGHRTDLERSS